MRKCWSCDTMRRVSLEAARWSCSHMTVRVRIRIRARARARVRVRVVCACSAARVRSRSSSLSRWNCAWVGSGLRLGVRIKVCDTI